LGTSSVGGSRDGGDGIKSLGNDVGEKSAAAASDDAILHNYVDDSSSSMEQQQQQQESRRDSVNNGDYYGYHSRFQIPQGTGHFWTLPSTSFYPRNNQMMLNSPSKRFGSSGTMEESSGLDDLRFPQKAQHSSPSSRSTTAHLLDLPTSNSPINNALSGYRLRPISYNLRGYSATGNGRLSGFLPPISPRKRQILFRQCFFNPISCF